MTKNRTKNRTLPVNKKQRSLGLKDNHFRILMLLGNGESQQKVAETLKNSKSTISFHINKLIEKGFLDAQKNLTNKGKEVCSIFLRRSEENAGVVDIRAHDLSFIAPISSSGSKFRDKLIEEGGLGC